MKKKTLMKKASLSMALIMMFSVTPFQVFAETTDAAPPVQETAAEQEVCSEEQELSEATGVVAEKSNLEQAPAVEGKPAEESMEATNEEAESEVILTVAGEFVAAESEASAPVAKEGLSYSGEGQQLITFTNDAEPGDGCVQYQARVGNSGQWQTNPQNVTGKDAGTYKVNIQKRTAYNSKGWHWTGWSNAGSLSVTVEKKQISFAGLKAKDKIYDGTVNAIISHISSDDFCYADGVNEEKLLVVTNSEGDVAGTFADKNVGESKTVTASADSFALRESIFYKDNPKNYKLTSVSGTGAIKQRQVYVSGINGVDKIYDGTTEAQLDFSKASFGKTGTKESGIIAGDNLEVSAKGEFSDSNVETGKQVVISELALSESSAANYKLASGRWAPQNETTANITERKASFIIPALTKIEGEADPEMQLGFENVLEKDMEAFTERFTLYRDSGEAAGTYAIHVRDARLQVLSLMAQGDDVFANYDISDSEKAAGSLTIIKADEPYADDNENSTQDKDANEEDQSDESVATGDSFSFYALAVAMFTAAMGACATLFRRKKE